MPDFSTQPSPEDPCRQHSASGAQDPLHLLIDSPGIKIEGEGEWNARKHGGAKCRVWRKAHLGIDDQTLEIRAVEVTSSDVVQIPDAVDIVMV